MKKPGQMVGLSCYKGFQISFYFKIPGLKPGAKDFFLLLVPCRRLKSTVLD